AAARPRGRGRRVLGWVFVIMLLIGIVLISMRFVATSPDLSGNLSPESPGPAGAKALAEVVRDQGVEIEATRSRAAAAAALRTGGGTLVMTDPLALSDEAATELADAADRTVLLTSSARMLR